MATITLSLVSHTNAGKTTLARTLLGREIGEVRDAPHVTEFAERHELVASAQGDSLVLWDTPGFGDSARLVRRLRQRSNPLGWLLAEVWDRWRDRPFWASQQALRHVQAESDVVLYLVNAAESPAAAGYVASEMELLGWVGKPVLVLLNQLGAPRAAADEQAELQGWREHLQRWPQVRGVLPLDAFARCWVHEQVLLHTVQGLLQGEAAQAMARCNAAWAARRQGTFEAAMQALTDSLARMAAAREPVAGGGWAEPLKRLGAALAQREDAGPTALAQQRLADALQQEVQASTGRLVALHGLQGSAQAEILARVANQFAVAEKVSEGRAALIGGAVTGALAGLKADIASGGLTLGGGLIAGSLLGALGAAGLARGINLVRGTGHSWVSWSDEALDAAVEAALLRYLAVAHFGRGRGDWAQGEAPPHWRETVARALAPHRAALHALWRGRAARTGPGLAASLGLGPEAGAAAAAQAAAAPAAEQLAEQAAKIGAQLRPVLVQVVQDVLQRLYPEAAAGPLRPAPVSVSPPAGVPSSAPS